MYHPLEKGNSQFQTILPLEKGELEGDKNPLNPKILRKEYLHAKHTSSIFLYLPLTSSNSLKLDER